MYTHRIQVFMQLHHHLLPQHTLYSSRQHCIGADRTSLFWRR